MKSLFLGSHPALDFLNTVYAPDGQVIETIGDGGALLTWLTEAELVGNKGVNQLPRRLGRPALDDLAQKAREMREWARGWLARWRLSPHADYAREVKELNRYLASLHYQHALDRELHLVEQPVLDSGAALLGLIAAQIAALVSEENSALVKSCSGPGCTLWFLDRTKAHRRLFCSASVCGNRAKVSAFRERQRS